MTSLRPARPDDVPSIAAIYNHAIKHTTAVWNDAERTDAQMEAWRAARVSDGFPVIVATSGSQPDHVLGFGSYGPFRPHDGFAATVEHSVYVAPDAQAKGIGRALLGELEAHARAASKHVMIGGIEAENEASFRLHVSCGFDETARLPEVGRKFGRWLTLVLMQKLLS